ALVVQELLEIHRHCPPRFLRRHRRRLTVQRTWGRSPISSLRLDCLSTSEEGAPGSVSRIRPSTIQPEPNVRRPIPAIAQGIPSRSATTPATRAPAAYPMS